MSDKSQYTKEEMNEWLDTLEVKSMCKKLFNVTLTDEQFYEIARQNLQFLDQFWTMKNGRPVPKDEQKLDKRMKEIEFKLGFNTEVKGNA
jgi:hypothetical protein